jgi:hypothetical protein
VSFITLKVSLVQMKKLEITLLETVVISIKVFGRKFTVICKKADAFCLMSFNFENSPECFV